ncbi:MAG: leucine-rich repeat protein [Prevotella sp.]|nr:leucine-rich repeat protein [Prevotella sp.]
MMKRTLLFLLSMMLTLGIGAEPITRQQALLKANAFMQMRNDAKPLSVITNRKKLAPHRVSTSGIEPVYVFNRGNSEGFVIVSGDDRTIDILGYSDQGEFDYTNLPDGLKELLADYAQQIEYLQENPTVPAANAVPIHPAIPKLLTCTWNQGNPYNQECPEYFGLGRSVTGCVATAMAQILYYQRAKSVSETQADIPAYDASTEHETYGRLHVEGIPKGSHIDWANMLDSYSGSETSVQKKAVADLMHYCGVSVEMDYTNSSSGAYTINVVDALKKYFGYGESVRYVYQAAYSNTDWDALLYAELANGNPFYLSGYNSQGGHAFVCDGYDGNHRFHINWGWGGSSDGYYLLNKLTPGSQGIGGTTDGYSDGEAAIIGIEPENYSDKIISFDNGIVRQLCVANWDTNSDGKLSYGEAASVTDIGTVFQGQSITTFKELKEFTSLTTIPDDAFNGCSKLVTIQLPNSITSVGARAFMGCNALKDFRFPENAITIGESAFQGCSLMSSIALNKALTQIEAHTFDGCAALTKVELPAAVNAIGEQAFANCTGLAQVIVNNANPEEIVLGTGVFTGINLSDASLTVHQGGQSLYAVADQWKEFGQIIETRTRPAPVASPLVTGREICLYNVGTKKFLTKGEAYGTQAIVGEEPARFILQHDNDMPANTYYIYDYDTRSINHFLFRTSNDEQVGTGVKAVFTDGALSERCYWTVRMVDTNTYTFQVPSGQSEYTIGQYWGVQTDHQSHVASPTWGVYYDVANSSNPNCQWQFIDYKEVYGKYDASCELFNLLEIAQSKHLNTEREQKIYNNFDSSLEELQTAMRMLRKKLGVISFEDPLVQSICIDNWDIDGDGELSYTEASMANSMSNVSFYHSDITRFNEFEYFTGIQELYGNSFYGCTKLTSLKLPESLNTIYYQVFMNCTSLSEIELPASLTSIGFNAFTGATALKTVILNNEDPSAISLDETAFEGLTLADMTLVVPHGSKDLYAAAPIWKDFGTIKEQRAKMKPAYSELKPDGQYYVYNLATKKYINKGEAYGTQAVASTEGILYTAKHTAAMGANVYYLTSTTSGASGSVLFRTSGDSRVGDGVKAVFVDGAQGSTANWQVAEDGEHIYTLQVPQNNSTYTEGQFLGVLPTHESNAASPTYGLYWDINYEEHPQNCQWAFISPNDMLIADAFNKNVKKLKNMLSQAAVQGIDAAEEQAVYDNFESTAEDIQTAIHSLSNKLGIIIFTDEAAMTICLNKWDMNCDDELSIEEASTLETISTAFRYNNNIVSLDELKYFTGITEIPAEAFYGCSGMMSLYIPVNVTAIGENAFKNCNKLKYIALLNEGDAPVSIAEQTLPRTLTLFVPASMVEKYQADAFWSKYTIEEYTGIPTVTAKPLTRVYGRPNSALSYAVSGAPINGEPALSCEADARTSVGEHPIHVSAGTITTPDLNCVDGVLTITPTPLTITAKSYQRDFGTENPAFEVTYKGFRNGETADVLTKQPVIECAATQYSPVGTYDILVSGAEALNYECTYVAGTLTVKATAGIETTRTEKTSEGPIYDLQGRRLNAKSLSELPTGIYVIAGKKVIK